MSWRADAAPAMRFTWWDDAMAVANSYARVKGCRHSVTRDRWGFWAVQAVRP